MTVRIKDVAKLAGVSSATVSRVLANQDYIKDTTREKVLKAIDDLGYQPSRVARSLRVNSSQIIALLVSDIQNPFFTTLARAVEDVAFANDYAVFLCNTDEDTNKESIYIDLMISERVAGMIITPTTEYNSPCKKLIDAHKLPLVAVDRQVLDCHVDTVVLNNQKGAYELVNLFIQKGHKRIGAIVGRTEITTGRERYLGYEAALRENNIPIIPELIKFGSPKEDVGYRFTNELLDLKERPTALFVGNNLLTMGALRAIDERGLSITKDISIAAFDETVWSKLIKPPLTVVTQPTYEMGIKAAELILARIQNPSKPVEFIQFEPQMTIRSSV
ncbi:MAG: LacI family transcriptional regulator [Chloroflexi bacterium]|nr:LacI family transcriptional regulator [Chloroflexota bacterium]